MWIRPRETLIQSQSQILQEFLYMTSSWPSLITRYLHPLFITLTKMQDPFDFRPTLKRMTAVDFL